MPARSTFAGLAALVALTIAAQAPRGSALAAGTPAAAPAGTAAAAAAGPARPSHPGGPGAAVGLTGSAARGAALFEAVCSVCHGPAGKDDVPNPGSTDGTVPALNPIDPTIAGASDAEFIVNADLFLEHGSRPEGPNPEKVMPAWGDTGALQPQQIADLIAYLISLNKAAGGTK
jgi:mono/diheme cytochrome c family protein